MVRKFGPKLFGPVRGPKIWSEVIWSGPWSEELVRTYLVRSEVRDFYGPIWSELLIWSGPELFSNILSGLKKRITFKKKILAENPDQTDFGPTYLVRNWSGTDFFPQ